MRHLPCLLIIASACNVEAPRHHVPIAAKTRQALSTGMVISEVYGGGGATSSAFRYDFIELFNLGSTPVNLNGWSVQYASETGTTWTASPLNGTVQPGEYFLIRMGSTGGSGGAALPMHNDTGTSQMSATAGKVALVNRTTAISGACPNANSIVDLVGYGMNTNCSEGMSTPNTTSTSSVRRGGSGCFETDNNRADFSVGTPTPRNAASGTVNCASMPNDGGVIIQPPSDAGCIVISAWPTDETDALYQPGNDTASADLYTAFWTDGGYDTLTFEAYFGEGLMLPATKGFMPGDSYGACELCVLMQRACNIQTQQCGEAYFAQAGSGTVTTATKDEGAGRFEGSLSNVQLVPWNFADDAPAGGSTCFIISSQVFSVAWNTDAGVTGGGSAGGGSAGGAAGGSTAAGGSAGGASTAGGAAGGRAGGTAGGFTGGGSAAMGGGSAGVDGGSGNLTTPKKPCGCSTGLDGLLTQLIVAALVAFKLRR